MKDEEKRTLFGNVCNDINCGTFILIPQYVDELIAKYTKVYRRKLRRIKKENAELKNRDCWKSCEYANPKSELIAQHIKDVQQLTKAKELIELLLSDNRTMKAQFESEEQANIWFKHIHQAEQFLSEVKK